MPDDLRAQSAHSAWTSLASCCKPSAQAGLERTLRDEPTVVVGREGAVSTITLNDPERLNAFTQEMADNVVAAMTDEVR